MNVLEEPCPVCKAKPGQECVNIIAGGETLPGRRFHYGRSEMPYCLRCGIPHPRNQTCGRDQ